MNNISAPFLSVIIPCCNSRNTIERLLDSIIRQSFSDMEVIIQDDFSVDNFMELVEPYKDKLNIKYFKNKSREVHCPGNTRIDGLNNATGEWVTFIDHDDLFEDNVFIEFKKCIEFNNEKYLVVSDFSEYNPETNTYRDFNYELGSFWLHGKFYNRAFLKKYNIQFKEDLVTHEDHYFNQLVFGYLGILEIAYSILAMKTYIWIYDRNSTGKKLCYTDENGLCFIDRYYGEYISSVSEPLFMLYEKYPEKKNRILIKMSHIAVYAYFYYQSLYYRNNCSDYPPNKVIYGNYIRRIKSELNVSADDIIKIVYSDHESYNHMRDTVQDTCGAMIEYISFDGFIRQFI